MAAKTYTKKVTKTSIEDMPEAEIKDVAEDTVEKTPSEIAKEIVESKKSAIVEPKKIKQFSNEDMIPCICVRNNKVVYHSTKTDSRYEWSGYGDVCYVSYLDLVSLMSMKSSFLFDPCFVIDDEDVLADPRFSRLTKIYEDFLMVDNPEEFFDLDVNTLRRKLEAAPKSFKDLIATTAIKMVKEGTFESLPKLKAIDEILGTGLHDFI